MDELVGLAVLILVVGCVIAFGLLALAVAAATLVVWLLLEICGRLRRRA